MLWMSHLRIEPTLNLLLRLIPCGFPQHPAAGLMPLPYDDESLRIDVRGDFLLGVCIRADDGTKQDGVRLPDEHLPAGLGGYSNV